MSAGCFWCYRRRARTRGLIEAKSERMKLARKMGYTGPDIALCDRCWAEHIGERMTRPMWTLEPEGDLVRGLIGRCEWNLRRGARDGSPLAVAAPAQAPGVEGRPS